MPCAQPWEHGWYRSPNKVLRCINIPPKRGRDGGREGGREGVVILQVTSRLGNRVNRGCVGNLWHKCTFWFTNLTLWYLPIYRKLSEEFWRDPKMSLVSKPVNRTFNFISNHCSSPLSYYLSYSQAIVKQHHLAAVSSASFQHHPVSFGPWLWAALSTAYWVPQ